MSLKITDITFVIVSYKSESTLYDCLDSIPDETKKIIVENSNNINLERELKTKYDNAHAPLLESLLSGVGLRDVFRFLNGDQTRSFTRETATIATRIDRLYAPARIGKIEWLTMRVNASFGRSEWNPDHKALEAELSIPAPVEMGKPPPSIHFDTYSLLVPQSQKKLPFNNRVRHQF